MIKSFIKNADSLILSGKLGKAIRLLKHKFMLLTVEKPAREYKVNDLSSGYISQYKKNDHSELNILCDKYGSDKGESDSKDNPYIWPSHNYSDFYDVMFRLRKSDVSLLVECGLGTNNPKLKSSMGINGKPGASLRVWRDYFPNAKIIGVDIDENVLFSETRIHTYGCDQTSQDSISKFATGAELQDSSVDIIIDDGLHTFGAGKSFFEGMIKFLTNNGIYVIEDVPARDIILYKDYFLQSRELYSTHFIVLSSPLRSGGDNRLICITKNV